MSAIPLFVRLRGMHAVLHERGYAFDVPASLKSDAYFVEQRDGKARSMMPVPGSKDSGDGSMLFINLHPYRNVGKAFDLIQRACALLPRVLEGGSKEAKTSFGAVALALLDECGARGSAYKPLALREAKSRDELDDELERFVDEALGINA